MRMEELKNEFPEMPEEMRNMIEETVQHQMASAAREETRTGRRQASGKYGETQTGGVKRKAAGGARKTAILSFVAVLALGATVFAGSRFYEMYLEDAGQYGAKTVVHQGETEKTAQQENGAVTVGLQEEIPEKVDVALTYLPEGMERRGESNKYALNGDSGISLVGYRLDEGETFEMTDKAVTEKEEVSIGDHKGVYLTRDTGVDDGGVYFDKILYVSYPEYGRVMQMFASSLLTKEETLKIAEGVVLTPGEGAGEDMFADWTEYLENAATIGDAEEEELRTEITAEEFLGSVYKVGDEFPILQDAEKENGEFISTENGLVTACVTDVQIADDLSLLDSAYIDEKLQLQADENGVLRDNELQFIKSGDGVDTIDEVIKTETVGTKLVYVTLAYTNHGDETLHNINVFGFFPKIMEIEGGYRYYDRAREDAGAWDIVADTAPTYDTEMDYYDLDGGIGTHGSNYISTLEPGATVEVHLAKVVNEDELDKLYLQFGGGTFFDEYSLRDGYIDLRQTAE